MGPPGQTGHAQPVRLCCLQCTASGVRTVQTVRRRCLVRSTGSPAAAAAAAACCLLPFAALTEPSELAHKFAKVR